MQLKQHLRQVFPSHFFTLNVWGVISLALVPCISLETHASTQDKTVNNSVASQPSKNPTEMNTNTIPSAKPWVEGKAAESSVEMTIRSQIGKSQPDISIGQISTSLVAGLYQVQLKSGHVIYVTGDGSYVFQGNLFQVSTNGDVTNLTEAVQSKLIAEQINAIPTKEMIVFPAKNRKTFITVFTDTDCGYCQKLHADVPALNQSGIEVRYLAFPRKGELSESYQTMVSIWCHPDPTKAMTQAKQGESIDTKTCSNPVLKQFELGKSLGVSGTPTIVLANGQLITGYIPAAELTKQALAAAQPKS